MNNFIHFEKLRCFNPPTIKSLFVIILIMFFNTSENVFSQSAELFSQDFETSANLASYVNNSQPSNGQFTFIGAYIGGDISRRIENGALVFEKTASSNAYGILSRTYDFSGPPTTMMFSFDLTVSGVTVNSGTGITLGIGNNFPVESVSNPGTSTTTGPYYIRSSIRLDSTGFVLGGQTFSGKNKVVYFLNNSGTEAIYTAPDGSRQTLANDKFDVWVNLSRVITASGSYNPNQVLGEMHIKFAPVANGKVEIDNLLINTFDQITGDDQAPTAPANLQAFAAETSINLSWNASTDNNGVAAYKIYNGDNLIGNTANTNYTVVGLLPSTLYFLHVTAIDAANNESARGTITISTLRGDTIPPSAPLNVTGEPSVQSIKVSWLASTDNKNIAKYNVYRNSSKVGETTSTNYTVFGLTPSTTYLLDVTALDSSNNESAPGSVSVTTLAGDISNRGLDPFYGMHIGTDTDIPKAINSLKDIGVYWTRIWLDIKNWSDPAKDSHSGVVSRATALKNAGFNVCLNLNANAGVVPASYEEAKAYFEFLWNIPGLKEAVDLWEIHNELNLYNDYWKGTAEEYVNRSLKAGWEVFHIAGGEQVLGGSFTLGQDTWAGVEVTQRYVDAGYLNYCDFAGTHPYATSLSELKTHFNKIQALYGTKPIFISEWNFKWSQTLANDLNNWSNLVKQAFDFYKNKGVKGVCYYRLLDGGDKQYWPGVISSGTYNPIQPFYNMYKSQPKTPDESIAAPTISITKPAVIDTIPSGNSFTMEASANDSDGTVEKVTFFYNGNKLIGEDSNGTDGWGITWNNIPAGRYVISALATDIQGATTGSFGPIIYSQANTTGKVISINFKGTGSALDSTDMAGIVPRKFWNNAVNSATVTDLLDENGENTGATVSNNLPSNYKTADPGSNADFKMMNGYIASYDNTTKEINVNSLPAVLADSSYDVYIFWGNQDNENDYVQFTINGKSFFLRDNTNKWDGTYTLSNAQSAEEAASGASFIVFKNLTGSSFKIGVKAFNTYRAGICGIQIVSSDLSPRLGTISITNPVNGKVYKDKDTINLVAQTSDFGMGVKKVIFLNNGTEIVGVDSVEQDGWSYRISGIDAGMYSFNAVSIVEGNFGVISSPVSTIALGEAGDVISINFAGGGPLLDPEEAAGKVLVTNWNNSNYNTTTPLMDANGSSTGASVTNNLPAAYSSFDGTGNGDYKMMKGYIANFTAGTKEVMVTNLPNSYAEYGYDVYVYWGNKDNENDGVEYTLNGSTFALRDNTQSWDGTHNISTATTFAEAINGPNYVLFEGVTGSTFTLKVTGFGTYRSGISGIQIVRSNAANAKIINPSIGDIFYENQIIKLSAVANNLPDSVNVNEMAFYYNNNYIGSDKDSTGGWTVEWKDFKHGSYSITAVAKTDSTEALSKPVNIRVGTEPSRVISVNFMGNTAGVNQADTIGAVPSTFWNNSNSNIVTDSLFNGNGDITNTIISNNIPSAYQSFDAVINGDYAMMKGYIANYNGDINQIFIRNIPPNFVNNSYNLFVYWGNKDTDNDYVSYNIDSTTFFIRDNNEKWDGTYELSNAQTPNDAKTGNDYVVFENLKKDSIILNIQSFATYRGGISGLQLVANKPKGKVILTNVKDSSEYLQCAVIEIGADTEDFGMPVKQVEFYVGNNQVGIDTVETDGWNYVWTEPVVGVHQLKVKAIDGSGYYSISQPVNIIIMADSVAPTIIAPIDIYTDTDPERCSAVAYIGDAQSSDNCGAVTITAVRSDGLALDAPFNSGITTIQWKSTDRSGNTSEANQKVTVNDGQVPSIYVNPERAVIWPPNNKFVNYSVQQMVDSVYDNCSGSVPVENVSIISVTSNETDRRVQYIIANDKKTVKLLAARDGSGIGRIYTIELEVTDYNGNKGRNRYEVYVPHDFRKIKDESHLPMSSRLIIYPNPSSGNFSLEIPAELKGLVRISIINNRGYVVHQLLHNIDSENRILPLTLSLETGVYMIKITCRNKIFTSQLFITK